VRKALIEGASWWEQAFEAAGFRNAFQVKVLPPDVDPMDIRYNVIQWVHRFTRGWSYGNAITDPRTGEILKGQVTLGSLRYRQDYLIFSSLLAPFGPSSEPLAEVNAAVYARLRQLAAHETGHTLGLAHNYIASTHDRASVMDYPHPMIDLHPDGSPGLGNAYATGIGSWDKVAIRYGYSQFRSGVTEKAALDKIIMDAAHEGNIFITDADSRPLGSAHPKSHLWDNGSDAVAELQRLLKIRRAAIDRFGENNVRAGQPMSYLDETLVPLYFLHRYQTEATAKVLGGLNYTYVLRGDGQAVTAIVPADEQRRALGMLLKTVDPETLTIPERILKLLPPHPPGYDRTRESFPSETGLTFDPVAAAQAAANLTGSLLFDPARDARLVEYHVRDSANPGLTELLDGVAKATWFAPSPAGLPGAVKAAADGVLFEHALGLLAAGNTSPLVRSGVSNWLSMNRNRLPAPLSRQLADYQRNPKEFQFPRPPDPPPGQPIGEDECVRPSLPHGMAQ
jgi:Met-zincin